MKVDGWEVTPDNTGLNINIVGDGDANITFPPNNTAQDITYTVKYTNSIGDCGSTTFTVKKSDSPVPPVGDCEKTSMGSMSADEVFDIAVNCTELNNGLSSWRAPNSGWTISIENRLTDYYIPFNGIARIAVGQTEESTSLYVISYRAVNEGHMLYGKTKDRTQDSNILIPPRYRVIFEKCAIESNIPAGHEAVSKKRTHFQTSMLKGSETDLKQHNEHVEQCYSAKTSINLTNKEVKFIIDSVCDWGGETDPAGQIRYYGIKKTADGKPEHYTDKVGSNGNRYIVPVNIFRSSNNDDFADYNPLEPLDNDMRYESIG